MKANKNLNIKRNTSAQVGIGTLIIFIAMVLVAAVAAAVLIQTSGVLQQQAQATGKEATQEVSSNLQVRNVEGIRASNSSDLTKLSSTVDLLRLTVGLNVGSASVDVNQLVISITDGRTSNNLVYAGNEQTHSTPGAGDGNMAGFNSAGSADGHLETLITNTTTVGDNELGNNAANYFTVAQIRDEDGSFSQGNPVMNTGDLILLYIATTSKGVQDNAGDYNRLGTITDIGGDLKDSGLNLVPRTTVNIVMTPEAGATTTVSFVTPSSYGVRESVQLYP